MRGNSWETTTKIRVGKGIMQLASKFTVKPTAAQEIVLRDLSENCRLLYNFSLFERKFLYEQYGLNITYKQQQNGLPLLKKQFPRYKQVYSKVLQMTLNKLDSSFKSFFGLLKNGDSAARPPNYRGISHFFTLCYNQSGFRITRDTITLSHKHPDKVALTFAVPFDFTNHAIVQIDLHRDRRGLYWLSVVHEFEEPDHVDNGLYQAFDLGTNKHSAVNLHGKFFDSTVKRADKYWQPKVRKIQRRMSHCKRGSRKWKKLQLCLNIMKAKEANQTKDWQHKQALNYLRNTKANTIIVGDLSPKQMANTAKQERKRKGNKGKRNSSKSLRLSKKLQRGVNRSVHNTGHLGRFVQFLTYKARKMGKRTIEIDERHTTMMCCACEHEQEMPLWKRTYLCENPESCSNTQGLDRDWNSDINIMVKFFSLNGLWTAYQYFAGKLRYTADVDLFPRFAKDSQKEIPCASVK
ncbi:MAG: RNA-guided endonuclease InsQ/TnpB family protein [Candidatus Hodarchaeales archaeon]